MALERLKSCRNATELAAELGIHRTQLYKWRDQMEPIEDGPGPAANSGERELRKEIRELKRVLGEKVLEVEGEPHVLVRTASPRRSQENPQNAQTWRVSTKLFSLRSAWTWPERCLWTRLRANVSDGAFGLPVI
jgi:transposase-like protein